jgi:hypothetical protein
MRCCRCRHAWAVGTVAADLHRGKSGLTTGEGDVTLVPAFGAKAFESKQSAGS